MGDTTSYDKACVRKQELRDDIETIGTRATWLLGILVLLIIALASFVFQYLDVELEKGSFIWVVWSTSATVCVYYLALLFYYVYLLVAPNFDGVPKQSTECEEVEEKIRQDAIRLNKLAKQFKTFLYLFVASAPTALLYALTLWCLAT